MFLIRVHFYLEIVYINCLNLSFFAISKKLKYFFWYSRLDCLDYCVRMCVWEAMKRKVLRQCQVEAKGHCWSSDCASSANDRVAETKSCRRLSPAAACDGRWAVAVYSCTDRRSRAAASGTGIESDERRPTLLSDRLCCIDTVFCIFLQFELFDM